MEIEDAFTQEAIADAGVDVSGHEENQLRDMVKQLLAATVKETPELTPHDVENIAVLSFVAGRTYQSDMAVNVVQIAMGPELIGEFLNFLVERNSE